MRTRRHRPKHLVPSNVENDSFRTIVSQVKSNITTTIPPQISKRKLPPPFTTNSKWRWVGEPFQPRTFMNPKIIHTKQWLFLPFPGTRVSVSTLYPLCVTNVSENPLTSGVEDDYRSKCLMWEGLCEAEKRRTLNA